MYRRVINAITNTPPTGELAKSSSAITSGNWDLGNYNPDDLIGRKGIDIYYKMLNDEQVKAALLIKKYAVLAGGYVIEPGSDSRKDKKAADYVDYSIKRMAGSFDDVLLEILTAIDFGYSITEENYLQYADGPHSGMWGIKSLKTKTPDEFSFDTDEYGNLKSIIQGYEKKGYPPDKFIIYSYNKKFGNLYGRSDLREAYRSWWSKNMIIKWWNMLLERFGIPPVVGKYQSEAQRATLQTIIERLMSKTSITLPKDTEIEMIESTMRGADVFEKAIRYHDGGIAKAVLLPSLSGFAEQSGVGSYAQAKEQFNAFMWIVFKIQRDLSETVIGEQLIRRLVDYNMEVTEYPKLVFPPLSDEQLDYIFNLWFVAIEKGAVKSTPEDEKHIRTSLGFPERDMSKDDVIDVIPTPGAPPPPALPAPPATPQPEEVGKPEGETTATFALIGTKRPELKLFIKQKAAEKGINLDRVTPEQRDWLDKQVIEAGLVDKSLSGVDFTGTIMPTKSLSRQPNKFEKKVGFVQLQKDMDSEQAKVQKDLTAILERSRKGLVKWLEPKYWKMKPKDVKVIELKNKREMTDVFKKFSTDTYTGGKDKAKSEIPKAMAAIKSPGTLPATQALSFFAEKADFYVTGITGRLEGEVHNILYNGLKTGEGVKSITEKINEAFKPYLGDPTAIVDDKVVDPFRLETVIRTNYTEAYNQGRKDMFADPDVKDFIIGIEYSNILDARTTDVCTYLDGKIFKPDSPGLDMLTPPNHYNCRSVIVPVTKDEGPVEFITEAEINTAMELKGKGF